VYMCVYAATVHMYACSMIALPVRESTDDAQIEARCGDRMIKRSSATSSSVGWWVGYCMMRISSLSQRRSKDVVIGLHMQRDATRTCIEVRPRKSIVVEKRERALCVSKLHGNSTMKYTCGGGAYQLDFGIHPKDETARAWHIVCGCGTIAAQHV
jgi:hypothetical protein